MCEPRVWIAQCMCPNRHTILASATACTCLDDVREAQAALKQVIAGLLAQGTINPWCGLCQSRDWHYEVARTPWRTMEDAHPTMAALEQANLETARMLRRSQN
jgi:hypothetical protein